MNRTILFLAATFALSACNTDTSVAPSQTPAAAAPASATQADIPKTYERWVHLHSSAQIEAIKEIEALCPSADFRYMWGDSWTEQDGVMQGLIAIKGSTARLAGEEGFKKAQETTKCAKGVWAAKS